MAESGEWTLATLKEHCEKLAVERDRRYTEVGAERERALRIKDEADKTALELARQIQTYKDEKANELREQISSERGQYITRKEHEDLIKSMTEIAKAQSSQAGRNSVIVGAATLVLLVVTLFMNYLIRSH